MTRHFSLEDELLDSFEYPIALTIEITKQGVILSKLRYLKTVGLTINETVRCPSIEVYAHMGSQIDSYLSNGNARPAGIDWIFTFRLQPDIFQEAVELIKRGELHINKNNPKTRDIAQELVRTINNKKRVSFKRLNPLAQGLVLEPYCNLIFQRAGEGERIVLQNVEVVNRENALRVRPPHQEDFYYPRPSPTMEIDLLVITEIGNVHSILDDLKENGFIHDRTKF